MQAIHSSSALACNMFHYWRRLGSGANGHLLYLFYDVPAPAGYRHPDEISRFTPAASCDGVSFASMSYQTLLLRLAGQRPDHGAWLDYMTERYPGTEPKTTFRGSL
jgi:hypothetical protein